MSEWLHAPFEGKSSARSSRAEPGFFRRNSPARQRMLSTANISYRDYRFGIAKMNIWKSRLSGEIAEFGSSIAQHQDRRGSQLNSRRQQWLQFAVVRT